MKTASELHKKHLTLISNFGYLTTRDLAMLAYPNRTPEASLRAAAAALNKLKNKGWVSVKKLPLDGETNAYILSKTGANLLCDEACALWFAHGYDLTMRDALARRPLLALVAALAEAHGGEPVGRRGIGRDYKNLAEYKGYDALLLSAAGLPIFGAVLAHGYNQTTHDRVLNLAKRKLPLVIATTNEPRLQKIASVRDKANPAMAEVLTMVLPIGLVA